MVLEVAAAGRDAELCDRVQPASKVSQHRALRDRFLAGLAHGKRHMTIVSSEQALRAFVVVFPIECVHEASLVGDQQHAPGRCVEAFALKSLAVHRLLLPSWADCRSESPILLAEYGHERRLAATELDVRKPLERAERTWHKQRMDLDHDACYRALSQRDSRFDGRFFTAVKTTGIYCRPVCPARTPEAKNVIFYASAAAAQEAGFRPCLRCRPETAPDMGAWRGTSNTVSRALSLIELGALDQGDVETLAERLGVGERQLRRLFRQHLGATPVGVAQTRRVLLAKQLIHETRLPMAEIAFASGFGSVRRFNEAFLGAIRARARRTPTLGR